MGIFLTENILLLEFLVVELTYDYDMIKDLQNMGETIVRLQFLDYGNLAVTQDLLINHEEDASKNGKSFLFSLTPNQAEEALQQFDIHIWVYKRLKCAPFCEKLKIGECLISLVELYQRIMLDVLKNKETAKAKIMHGSYKLTNMFGNTIGEIKLFIRMSCFGKLIVSQFKMDTRTGLQVSSLLKINRNFEYTSNDSNTKLAKSLAHCNVPIISSFRATDLSSGEPGFHYRNSLRNNSESNNYISKPILTSTLNENKMFLNEKIDDIIKIKKKPKWSQKFGKKKKSEAKRFKSPKRTKVLDKQYRLSAGGIPDTNVNFQIQNPSLISCYCNEELARYNKNNTIVASQPINKNNTTVPSQPINKDKVSPEVDTIKLNIGGKKNCICTDNNNVELEVSTPKGKDLKPKRQLISEATCYDFRDFPEGYLEAFYGKEKWKQMMMEQMKEEKRLAALFGDYGAGKKNANMLLGIKGKGGGGKNGAGGKGGGGKGGGGKGGDGKGGDGKGGDGKGGDGKGSGGKGGDGKGKGGVGKGGDGKRKGGKKNTGAHYGGGILKDIIPECSPCRPCVPCVACDPCRNPCVCDMQNICNPCGKTSCW